MTGNQPVYGGFADRFIVAVIPGVNEYSDVLNYTRFRAHQITGQTDKKTLVTTTESEWGVVVLFQDGLDRWIEPFCFAIVERIRSEAIGHYFSEGV